MKFIKWIVDEYRANSFGMNVLLTLLIGCALAAGMLILAMIDMTVGWKYDDEGVAWGHSFIPAYCTTTMITSGNVVTPVTTCVDDAWYLKVDIDGETYSCETTELNSYTTQPGETVETRMNVGIFSRNKYCIWAK